MSSLLVDTQASNNVTSAAAYADVPGLGASGVVVGSADSVLLLIATIPSDIATDGDDQGGDLRFAIDGVREGPDGEWFKDGSDDGCGISLCYAVTGLSGSHEFRVEWRTQNGGSQHISTSTRERSFQVIEITDASLLVDLSSTALATASSTYADIPDMVSTPTVAGVGSILLILANWLFQETSDSSGDTRFQVDNVQVGPELSTFSDADNEACGYSGMWFETGLNGATEFAVQWKENETTMRHRSGRERRFQVIEITAKANLLTKITSLAAGSLGASFADVGGLVDTVSVAGTGSILLFAAGISPNPQLGDDNGEFRIGDGGVEEGPSQQVFHDGGIATDNCGHCVYWAATGKAAGNHTFSLRGRNLTGGFTFSTAKPRSLAIVELLAGVADLTVNVADAVTLAEVQTTDPVSLTEVNEIQAVTLGEIITVRLPLDLPALSEAITVGEATDFELDLPVSAVDVISTGEVITLDPVSPTEVNELDAITVSDPAALTMGIEVSELDAVTVAELVTLAPVTTTEISEIEAITVGETITLDPVSLTEINEVEAIIVGETVTLFFPFYAVEEIEAIAVGETVTVAPVFNTEISETEAITVGEAVTVNTGIAAFHAVEPTEAITVGEAITLSVTTTEVSEIEAITVGETVALFFPFHAVEEIEAVTVGEAVTFANPTLPLVVSDAVTVGEVVTIEFFTGTRTVSVADAITVGELVQIDGLAPEIGKAGPPWKQRVVMPGVEIPEKRIVQNIRAQQEQHAEKLRDEAALVELQDLRSVAESRVVDRQNDQVVYEQKREARRQSSLVNLELARMAREKEQARKDVINKARAKVLRKARAAKKRKAKK